MSTDVVNKAKQWCDEAWAILKLAKSKSSEAKAISKRAKNIASELKTLKKQLDSGKASIDQEAFDEYLNHFSDLGTRLKAAAEQHDSAEVDRLSGKLSALKKDLAVQLANKDKAKAKKQKRLDERLLENQTLDKRKFEQDYPPLQARINAVLSWSVTLSPIMTTAKSNLEDTNSRMLIAKNSNDYTAAVTVMIKDDLAARLKAAEDALAAAKLRFETEFPNVANYAAALDVVSDPMPEVAQEILDFNAAKDLVELHQRNSDWVAASAAVPELARTAKELCDAKQTAVANAKIKYETAYTAEIEQAHKNAVAVVANATEPMKKKLAAEIKAFESKVTAHDTAVGASEWGVAEAAVPDLESTAEALNSAKELYDSEKQTYELAKSGLTELPEAQRIGDLAIPELANRVKKFDEEKTTVKGLEEAGDWPAAEVAIGALKSAAEGLINRHGQWEAYENAYTSAIKKDIEDAIVVESANAGGLATEINAFSTEKAKWETALSKHNWPHAKESVEKLAPLAKSLILAASALEVREDPAMSAVPTDANDSEILAAGLAVARQAVLTALKEPDTRTKQDVATAKGLLVAVREAITKAEEAASKRIAKETFELAFAPLDTRAGPAKTKSDGVKGMEALRQAVIDQGTAIGQKVTAELFGDASGLLGAWDVAIKAVEDRLLQKVSYESAATAKFTACDAALDNAKFVAGKYGSNLPAALATAQSQLVAARKVVTDFVELAKFVEAEAALVNLGTKTTAVTTRLVVDNGNFENHVKTNMAKEIADYQLRITLLLGRMTGVVGGPDLATPNQFITNQMAAVNGDYIALWKTYEKLPALFAKAEDHLRNYEAYNYAMEDLEKRYIAASNVSKNVTALATPHQTMVNARKIATDLRDLGKYIEAKAALPAFESSMLPVEEALTAKLAYEKAADPVLKRETAAELVSVPAPVNQVDSPLVAMKAAMGEARVAIDSEVNTAKYAEAQAKLTTLDDKASAVLAFEAKAAAISGVGDPKTSLQSLKDQEGDDTLLAKLTADLATSEPDTSPALKAAIELQFGVTLTATTTDSSTTWSTDSGVTATSLAEMYQLMHKDLCTSTLGPLRVRFEKAKTDSDGVGPISTPRGTMISTEQAVKDEETADRYVVAMEKVPAFVTALEAVEVLAKNYTAFKAAYDPVKRRFDTADAIALPTPPPPTTPPTPPPPESELSKAKKAMTEAHTKVTTPAGTGDYVGALALVKSLDTAVNAVFAARAVEDAKTNPANAVATLDALDPGGPKVLDAFIAGLDKAHPKYHEVLQAALKKRFKLDVVQQFNTKTALGASPHSESLKHLYDLFNMVPDRHVRDNTALTELKQYTEQTGGADYTHFVDPTLVNWGQINLNCGRPSMTGQFATSDENKNLGHAQAFPDGIDDDCRPADNDPITYFDFATLHEVGHAVDWRAQFMAGHITGQPEDTKYGGWTQYADASGLVTAATTHFQTALDFGFGTSERDAVLSTFIEQVIAGSSPTNPVSPNTSEAANTNKWNAAFDEIRKWGTIDRSWSICRSGTKSLAAKVGDHVYQKDGSKWYRYEWAARSKGLTGYQFRAPAEWFAELYAGYYSGKLKKNHPFNDLIKPLL